MPTVEEPFPNHGDPKDWVALDTEETRCLNMLKQYYIIIEDCSSLVANEKAWLDIKREFKRLVNHPWYM